MRCPQAVQAAVSTGSCNESLIRPRGSKGRRFLEAAAAAPGLESEAAPWNAGTGLDPASSQPAGGRSP
ncbi:unnamed protein product [Boreogadus saida]